MSCVKVCGATMHKSVPLSRVYMCVGYSSCLVASCHAVLPIVPIIYEGPS